MSTHSPIAPKNFQSNNQDCHLNCSLSLSATFPAIITIVVIIITNNIINSVWESPVEHTSLLTTAPYILNDQIIIATYSLSTIQSNLCVVQAVSLGWITTKDTTTKITTRSCQWQDQTLTPARIDCVAYLSIPSVILFRPLHVYLQPDYVILTQHITLLLFKVHILTQAQHTLILVSSIWSHQFLSDIILYLISSVLKNLQQLIDRHTSDQPQTSCMTDRRLAPSHLFFLPVASFVCTKLLVFTRLVYLHTGCCCCCCCSYLLVRATLN